MTNCVYVSLIFRCSPTLRARSFIFFLSSYILKTVVLFCVYNLKRSIKCADNKTNTKRTTTKTKKRRGKRRSWSRSRSRRRSEVGLNPFFIALILSVYGQAIKPSNSHRAAHPFGIICPEPPLILHFFRVHIFCTFLGPRSSVFCYCLLVCLFFAIKGWLGFQMEMGWGWREGKGRKKESTRQSKAGAKGGCCVCKSFRRFDWLINQLGFNGGYKGYKAEQWRKEGEWGRGIASNQRLNLSFSFFLKSQTREMKSMKQLAYVHTKPKL